MNFGQQTKLFSLSPANLQINCMFSIVSFHFRVLLSVQASEEPTQGADCEVCKNRWRVSTPPQSLSVELTAKMVKSLHFYPPQRFLYLRETKSWRWEEAGGGEKVSLKTHATARGVGKNYRGKSEEE